MSAPHPADPTTIPSTPRPVRRAPSKAYSTDLGTMYEARIEDLLDSHIGRGLRGEVQMLFTSPPFPLNRKKRYGNLVGAEYLEWLGSLAAPLGDLLTEDGSFVVELGNAWEPGEPVMSTLALEALLELKRAGNFHVCQQFVVNNPARLPSPAQWVNVERSRVKDSYTNVWWFSRVTRPKASNRNVLTDYSPAMRKLIERGSYNAGERPSQHRIGTTSFLQDHGGAIPSNVLTMANTNSRDAYRRFCNDNDLELHPARMAPSLPEFFLRFLTDPGDLVLDPFGGSNTTGAAAEALNRRWIATEPDGDYIAGSKGRFLDAQIRDHNPRSIDLDAVSSYLEAQDGSVSRSQIAQDLGIDATAAQWRRALTQLVNDGTISALGNARGRRYRTRESTVPNAALPSRVRIGGSPAR